jgi:hypothetical protein
MTINLYLRPSIPYTYPLNIPLAEYSSSGRNGTLSAKRFVHTKTHEKAIQKLKSPGNDILQNQLTRNSRTFLCSHYYFSVARDISDLKTERDTVF